MLEIIAKNSHELVALDLSNFPPYRNVEMISSLRKHESLKIQELNAHDELLRNLKCLKHLS